ncbi:TolC family protein [Pseudomonas syringae pv. syringae]|uniref:TolC family protein n=1 Tax=Pseudomonas syringae TaxID=317 RepID=UPI001F10709B|nr:TolC family protein [Pseudomonas syringae]MCH5633803.1 TolC family protein [Pseudomonas syringae pv. syringae]MCH5663029.1 TolC family protein [Pseudomonas syringae pv. syringae]
MPALPTHRRHAGVLAMLLLSVYSLRTPAADLTFERAQQLALTAPENLAGLAQVQSAQESIGPAGALPDPKLILGIDNLPIEGQDRYSLDRDSMTMRRVGLMQEFPNSDKREARRRFAQAAVGRTQAEQRATLLETKRQAALGWLEVFYAEQTVDLFDEMQRQISLQVSTLPAQVVGGTARAADLIQARQETLTLEDRRDELARDVAIARAKLRRYIGADADLKLSGPAPIFDLNTQLTHNSLSAHPDLKAASARVTEANAELDEAIAAKKPDWGVAFVYGNRDNRFGDMVSVQFTFDLPIFVGSRQGPRIAAKQRNVAQMEAQQEVILRAQESELESGLAEVSQVRKALERNEATNIPLASKRVALETASYKAGTGQLRAVIEARRALIEARLRRVEQQRKLHELSSNLYFAYVEGLE